MEKIKIKFKHFEPTELSKALESCKQDEDEIEKLSKSPTMRKSVKLRNKVGRLLAAVKKVVNLYETQIELAKRVYYNIKEGNNIEEKGFKARIIKKGDEEVLEIWKTQNKQNKKQ